MIARSVECCRACSKSDSKSIRTSLVRLVKILHEAWMRNTANVRMSATRYLLVLASLMLLGCGAATSDSKTQLNSGYRDLEQHRYESALATADAFLRKYVAGAGSAEALYLQGRVHEARADAAGQAG